MSNKPFDIYSGMKCVDERSLENGQNLDDLFAQGQPFIIRGLVKNWPLVQAGLKSSQAARDYLLERHIDRPFVVSAGSYCKDGRIFYHDNMALNVQTGRSRLPDIFKRMEENEGRDEQPIIYVASTDVKTFFNGLHEDNHVALNKPDCLASIWIGLRTRIAAHNDFPDNLACVAVGKRRFTLFPPEQFRNLYLGPIDNTPAGRVVSMVDFHNPDFDKYPNFRDALETALVADLEPGDALHIPSMWWHHVEGTDPFNILINYWWRETPRHMGQPQDALNHAIMSIRDLPPDAKKHWRDLFDYYVFNNSDDVTAHIPKGAESVLGPMTAEQSGKIRAFLLRALNQ